MLSHLHVIIFLTKGQEKHGGDILEQKAMDAARNARNAYARQWRAKNKERVRESNLRYWARRAEREAAAAEAGKDVEHGRAEN